MQQIQGDSFSESNVAPVEDIRQSFRVFLGVAENMVSSLLCCSVGIFQFLFNLHLVVYVSSKLSTYPSPKPALTLTSVLKKNVGLVEG